LVLEEENIQALTSKTLNKRLALTQRGEFSHNVFQYANEFKDADYVVVAAPYWDFGFPAILKTYIEAIDIPGIVYQYGAGGRPAGACKAEKLLYVTTRGGTIGDERDLGFATFMQMGAFYGIKGVKCVSADGFDIPAADIESLLKKAIQDFSNNLNL
jgi:FMN-dependent NADH-azoreductase